MASSRDAPLTKEEQEEEEMRDELKRTGFFFENMSTEDMRMILSELKESKNSNSQSAEAVPISPPSNEPKSTQNTSEEVEPSSDRPKPSYSYRSALTSGNSTAQSTSNEEPSGSQEKSPDSALSKSYGKNLNNENNSTDNEPHREKNSNVNKDDDYPMLGSKSNLKNNAQNTYDVSRLRPREAKKPTAAMIKRANLERWKLNPFQPSSDTDDDIPLKPPERVHTHQEECLPYSNEELDSETFEALCQQMSAKLDSLHERIVPELLTRERKTLWGSPIKVSPKWNGSAVKNSFVEKTSISSSHNPDASLRDIHERATKRKALSTIAAVKQNNSHDENSDDEFVNTKKRKCQQGKKAEEVPKKNQVDQESKNSKSNSPVETIEVDVTKDSSDPEIFDNSEFHSLYKSKKLKTLKNTEPTEEESTYPRRVTPPNPAKKNFKGPRAKKKNANQPQSSSIKNKEPLNDEEISQMLDEPNADTDDNDCIEITEIKPSPISKNMKKMNMARSHLENVHTANEQKIKAEEEARKQKEMDEKFKKDELISKRLQEEEDEKSRKLQKERKLNEQESFYNNILGANKQRVTRSNFNKPKQNYAEMDEDELLADVDDDEPTITHANLVTKSCPICQKYFPADQIETHASGCDLFSLESNVINNHQPSSSYSKRDTSYYECGICNEYKTNDGNGYEEHVTKCRESAEDRRRSDIIV